jgi:phosphatidate cytidylyltransferase
VADTPSTPEPDGRRPRRRGEPHQHGDLQDQIRVARSEIRDQVRSTRSQFDEANARLTARSGRNLVFAIGVGVLLGGSFLLSLVLVKWLFVIVAAVLVGFIVYELTNALRKTGTNVPRVGSVVAGVLSVPAAYLLGPGAGFWAILGAVLVAVLWRCVTALMHPVRPTAMLRDLGATVFVQLYLTLLASCLVVLTAQPDGQWWTLTCVIVVVSVDIGAYATGLNFGKHKMAPRISPKKTWEGFAGSAAAALIAACLLCTLLLHEPIWFGLIFGAVMTLTATLGDLGESLIKRDLGVKDISSWLPGHGGFLDRLDSTLPSAAAALLLFVLAH